MKLPKRLLIAMTTIAASMALLGGALVVSSAVPFSSDTKPSPAYTDPKGTPIPASTASTFNDEWTVVPPEARTDIQMIDITKARIFLPGPDEAADCETGDLDPAKAEEVIRAWLSDNRGTLPRISVWDGTLILVRCSYPNDEFDGKLALYIGVPYDGYSYVAPASCQDKARGLPSDAPLPNECNMPADLEVPLEVDSYTIVVSPQEVLK